MTTILLRVLLVEDSEDDALLSLLELRKGGFKTEWERVDTRPGMERAVAERTWDLVICDHVMPGFSSAGALDVMRKRALDLPFIIVSGVAPEDLVTAAMRQGAHDFISKGNLVRLVPAVQRELREATLRQDRRRMESRLAEVERQLRQAQKMDALGVLAAGIAHDFNNVLTTILASAELIKCKIPGDSPLLPKVDAILHAGLCAAGLTRQILGFSRKADEVRLPLDLTAIVRDGLQTLHSSIPDNVELREELTSGVWVEADPALIHQVVLNLAINALQALQPGGGILQVSLAEEGEEQRVQLPGGGEAEARSAVLTVRDTGCGMDAAVQERIFEPFFSTKPAGQGTGLGLAMVHATVTKAGGRVSVQSAPGQGSTFQVRLPAAAARDLPRAEELPQDAAGSESILFLDDDQMTAAIARLGLKRLGYQVASFTRPEEALAAFTQHPGGFDLAFLDLSMEADMDLPRRLQELRPGLPMILMTGQAAAGTLSASVHASFQGIVTRPFTALDLAHALRKAMQFRPKAGSPAAAWAPGPRPLILLAEDSRTTRSMIRSGLERAGYAVQEARDGLEAWEMFTQAPHGRRFDLLLTDVVMPRMDGLELVQLVRKADPALPIGVLTSNEDHETLKSAMHLGVNEFLNKPFELGDLTACVQSLLAERSSRLDARRSLETAQAVRMAQRSMLAAPEKGVPLFTLHEPLTDAGGDVFRCFTCADGSILFILADVAGHSVLSSYAVASFLGMLSSYVGECYGLMALSPGGDGGEAELPCSLHGCGRFGHQPCDPLPHLAMKLNHGIQSGPFSEVPVCALLGLWNPATGRLQLLNAGIPHGIHYRRGSKEAGPVRINGTPLGVFPEADLEGAILQLEPGDRLLFGTDGFFEVTASGKGPFQDLVPGHWQASAASPLDWSLSVICEAAHSHGDGVLADDLLVVGFEQPSLERAGEEMVLRLPSTARAIDMACDRLNETLKASGPVWGVGQERRFDIVLAVREALANAVFHGNGNRPGTFITLSCRPEPPRGRLVVAVADEGPGFDMEAHRPPLDPLSDRGRGIPLIRHHAQEVRMTGNALTMTFQLEETPHADH
jgi:DNA-binding NtrC family response regulator/anti-sigma regulatory factor (Ser/Thr protein kinase)